MYYGRLIMKFVVFAYFSLSFVFYGLNICLEECVILQLYDETLTKFELKKQTCLNVVLVIGTTCVLILLNESLSHTHTHTHNGSIKHEDMSNLF